jgi:hypothetical protein
MDFRCFLIPPLKNFQVMISAKHAHLFFVVAILFPSLVNSTPNSVCNDPGYALLRPCAAYCVGCDPRPDQIGYEIGCGPVPPNECWCRVDLFALATSALSSCVSKSCTIGGWAGDYSSAQRFYTSYCQKAGFTAVVNGPANSNALTTAVQSAPPGTGGGYTSGECFYANRIPASMKSKRD